MEKLLSQEESRLPAVSVFEASATKKSPLEKKIKRLSIPRNPDIIKRNEYDDILAEARSKILNEKMYERILAAAKEKINDHKVMGFAGIENLLIEKCLELKGNDIDRLIQQLNAQFIVYISRQPLLDARIKERITRGEFSLEPSGIKNTTAFVRERARLLMEKPQQNFMIGFNTEFDATEKVDLMEIIFGDLELSTIERLSFIQIKSSERQAGEESERIVEGHKELAGKRLAKLSEVNDNRSLKSKKAIGVNSIYSVVAVGAKIMKEEKISRESYGESLAATIS